MNAQAYNTDNMSKFDDRKFRNMLGVYPTGVTVITASNEEKNVGITANSFSSLSLDPPLILWSLIKSSSSYEVFKNASHFAINILAWDQINISNKFAKPSNITCKFEGLKTIRGLGGCILLPNTSAFIECKNYQIIDAGDHWLFIGEVQNFQENNRPSLAFYKGKYNIIESHPDQINLNEVEKNLFF